MENKLKFNVKSYEEWRPIDGYEGLYEVSNLGRVRSLDRVSIDKNGVSKHLKGSILRPSLSGNYFQVPLYRGNDSYQNFLIHRLVASAFLENAANKPQVNHKDGNTKNNVASNLEWVTASENIRHAYDIGKMSYKQRNYKKMGKLSGKVNGRSVVCVDDGEIFSTLQSAADFYHISINSVWDSCNDGREHCGHKFRYVDELKHDSENELIIPDDPIKQYHHIASPVRCLETSQVFKSRAEAARVLHISESSVRDSLRDGRSHCGYTFVNIQESL